MEAGGRRKEHNLEEQRAFLFFSGLSHTTAQEVKYK
jgi:hypothetical protein